MALILALLPLAAAFDGTPSRDALGECLDAGTWFEDVTRESGARAYGNTKGVTLNDLDGDGDIDMYVATGPGRADRAFYLPGESLVYLNDGRMHFTELGRDWGMDDLCEDRAPMWGDLDNDGLPDLYVTVNGRNLLYRNLGGGLPPFADVTASAGAAGHVGWGHQGFLFDYDRDGFLDIYFTNGPEDGSQPDTLLHNQGDGTFRDLSEQAGVAGTPSGKGACVLDADLDGWPDVFVTTGREYGNQLYINQRDGTFRDEALQRGVADPEHRFGVGVVCDDLDSDGDPDILLVTHDRAFTGNQLFENQDGRFVDVGPESGLSDWIDGHGLDTVDIDGDGLLDVVLSGIRTAPLVFANQGSLHFERLCDGAGIQQEDGITWAVVSGDLDADGWPEVLIADGLGRRPRPNTLFHNLGGSNHWLEVRVEGVTGNPSQLGAKVEVTTADGTRTRWVGDWSSFDSQGPLPVLVGLGAADHASQVRVTFTGGQQVVLDDVEADQHITVTEPAERADDDSDGVPDEWDICPATPPGRRHDAQGCARGQRRGIGLALADPPEQAVLSEPPTFTWDGQGIESAVLQVGTDGTFGPAGRIDIGPVEGMSATLDDRLWAELQAASDGSTPMLWRVAATGAGGAEAITPPRSFYVAVPTDLVVVPRGVNVFEPAHAIVETGSTLTWLNEGVSAGNLQATPHDVQLVDEAGRMLTDMETLNTDGWFSYTFSQPGTYGAICRRHSGTGTNSDLATEGTGQVLAVGPYRCMAGTVTAR